MSNFSTEASTLISNARSRADYDEPLFNTPELDHDLLDFARRVLAEPSAIAPHRAEDYPLYEAFDHVVYKSLAKSEGYEPVSQGLFNQTKSGPNALLIDCIHEQVVKQYCNIDYLLQKNPNLPEQLLNAAEIAKSPESLVQLIEIYTKIRDEGLQKNIPDTFLPKFLSLIKQYPTLEVLAAAACCFSDNPKDSFSKILHSNFSQLSNDSLRNKDSAILRYLLNNSPTEDVVRRAKDVGLGYRTEYDEYKGRASLLEAALYVQQNSMSLNMSFLGIGNFVNYITNRSLSARNFSESAALRTIISNLKSGQTPDVAEIAVKALAASNNPAALGYLKTNMQPLSFWGKLWQGISFSWSNMSDNFTRKSAAISTLRSNPDLIAQELYRQFQDS